MAIETLEITREKFERVPRGYAIPGQAAVFIVDDDKAMRAPLHAALCLCGYRVFTATTLQEAEEVGPQLAPESIKLVIANVHLIGIPHLQESYVLLLRQPIAHYGQHTLSSGETHSGELSPLLGRATGSFLAKPFTMEELLDVVWAHLRHNHPVSVNKFFGHFRLENHAASANRQHCSCLTWVGVLYPCRLISQVSL